MNFIFNCGSGEIELASKCFTKIILQTYPALVFRILDKKQEKFLISYPQFISTVFRGEKTVYPNIITPLVRLLGVNGKDAALS